MNETLWCYHLNESSLVELLLVLFISWDFTKKKSGIFVSFPFSSTKSERWLTLSISFYVNLGVAES